MVENSQDLVGIITGACCEQVDITVNDELVQEEVEVRPFVASIDLTRLAQIFNRET